MIILILKAGLRHARKVRPFRKAALSERLSQSLRRRMEFAFLERKPNVSMALRSRLFGLSFIAPTKKDTSLPTRMKSKLSKAAFEMMCPDLWNPIFICRLFPSARAASKSSVSGSYRLDANTCRTSMPEYVNGATSSRRRRSGLSWVDKLTSVPVRTF